MRTALKIFTVLLLLFNGTGAIYGGWNLMRSPDGSSLQIGTEWLRYSPFTDFFIPGLVLFCVNGLFSFVVLTILLAAPQRSYTFIILQGVLLSGWIMVQVLMMRQVVGLHMIMGSVGVLLVGCGYLLRYRANDAAGGAPVR